MAYDGDWQLSVDGLNATLTVGELLAGGGNATGSGSSGAARQPRYRQHDWAAISGTHGRSDGDGVQRALVRGEGFTSPQDMLGVRRRHKG